MCVCRGWLLSCKRGGECVEHDSCMHICAPWNISICLRRVWVHCEGFVYTQKFVCAIYHTCCCSIPYILCDLCMDAILCASASFFNTCVVCVITQVFLYKYVCVCMKVDMCVHVCLCMKVYVCTCVCTKVDMCVYMCVYESWCVCIYVCTKVYICVCVCVRKLLCVYMRVCMKIDMFVYVCVCVYEKRCNSRFLCLDTSCAPNV